jgi:hypothetical protein
MNRSAKNLQHVKARLLSRGETAKILGNIHVRTVDKLIKRGQLKSVLLGDRVMIVATSVYELIAA